MGKKEESAKKRKADRNEENREKTFFRRYYVLRSFLSAGFDLHMGISSNGKQKVVAELKGNLRSRSPGAQV